MGLRQNDYWVYFNKCSRDPKHRVLIAKCNYCNVTVSSTPNNMRTHVSNCNKSPSSVGRLHSVDLNVYNATLTISKLTKASSIGPLSELKAGTITKWVKRELDQKFRRAMHGTSTPFSFRNNPLWIYFFSTLAPNWKMHSPARDYHLKC